MRPAPPTAAVFVLALVLPPACREEVLGDLQERYTGVGPYLAEAVRIVPLVIASRILRTIDAQFFFMQACVLYLSFFAAARPLDSALLHTGWGLARLAIPASVALVALTLGDAYARACSPLHPLLSAALTLSGAFISQAALAAAHPDAALPRWILLSGAGLSVLLVSAVRMLFPPWTARLQSTNAAPEGNQSAFPLKGLAVSAAVATILIIAYELNK